MKFLSVVASETAISLSIFGPLYGRKQEIFTRTLKGQKGWIGPTLHQDNTGYDTKINPGCSQAAMVSKGREHKEGKNHVLFLSYSTSKWQIHRSPGSFPSDNIYNSSQTPTLGIIWAAWMLVQVQVGNIALPLPALFHSHWSVLNSLNSCSQWSGAACMWPAPETGKGTTRRDADDVSTTAWQLLWEPTAMLPLPNKPQHQHRDGLQRGAGSRDKGDVKGHLHLQS